MDALRANIQRGDRIVRVDLSNQSLDHFPEELLQVKSTVEFINLGNNQLSSLPEFLAEFSQLRILFFAQNNFTSIPSVLARLPNLYMLSFKSNRIVDVPEDSLPLSLQWLILTDNKISALPKSIGQLTKLRKVMLSGNSLTSLPEEMKSCVNIELIRLAVNQLTSIPEWLLTLPKLAWIALSGNPCLRIDSVFQLPSKCRLIDWNKLEVQNVLGEGASGTVYKGLWTDEETKEVAVKIYKGAITSDGIAEDEIEINECIGDHPSFVQLLGRVRGHPEDKPALVLSLLPDHQFAVLGDPPTFDSITRDSFTSNNNKDTTNRSWIASLSKGMRVLVDTASACAHLHALHIAHGDIYAHNLLVDERTGQTLLTDFGAASRLTALTSAQQSMIEAIEVLAFAHLIEDVTLLHLTELSDLQRRGDLHVKPCERKVIQGLQHLYNWCSQPNAEGRPSFKSILRELQSLQLITDEKKLF